MAGFYGEGNMSTSVKKTVKSLAEPLAQQMGYEYVDTEYAKEGRDWMLTVYIDKPDGVTIEDCEKYSRALEAELDVKDPIKDAYTLVISSPGLDRPLKTAADFARFLGTDVDVRLYRPFMGQKEFTGPLYAYTDTSVTLKHGEDETITFGLDETAKISLHVNI